MPELYVKVWGEEGEGTLTMPIETVVTLFVLAYCGDGTGVDLVLVQWPPEEDAQEWRSGLPGCIPKGFSARRMRSVEVDTGVTDCVLPVLRLDECSYITGLSAILRSVIKLGSDLHSLKLLGFRGGCLSACAEVSTWTKFCEVDLPAAVKKLALDLQVEIPADLVRLERHLEQPVRVHNLGKKQREEMRGGSNGGLVQHLHAEGPDLTLADVVLLPCVEVALRLLGVVGGSLATSLPLLTMWRERMMRSLHTQLGLEVLRLVPSRVVSCLDYRQLILPSVPNESLYKSDPRRYQPRSRLFTRQGDVSQALEKASQQNHHASDTLLLGFSQPATDEPWAWTLMPPEVHPKGGNLPASRLERKCGQLESVCKAAIGLAEKHRSSGEEVVLVDFCSGGGHVGLILAHLLPWSRVVLVENKEESMSGAKKRASRLGLTNLQFYQCNLTYYRGSFAVGVALHACGTATDLVLQRCIQVGAAFVVSPCCYGAVRDSAQVRYPRSVRFRRSALETKDYLAIAHAADQTHAKDSLKTEQGRQCMRLVDSDRLLWTRENGYRVKLMKLMPLGCTPKDHMLLGWPRTQSKEASEA